MEDEQKVFITLRAIFLEKEFLGEGTVASKIELGEVQPVKGPARSKDVREPVVIESHLKPSLRRSGRVSHQPDIYYSFLVRDDDPIELDRNNKDPITDMDALQRSDSEVWFGAMRSEMESMEINNVWTLVDLPEGMKPIGCK